MPTKTIDVIITVHVEEHKKFGHDVHKGHTEFYKVLLKRAFPFPLTLLHCRVKEAPTCPSCDRQLLQEIQKQTNMEIGLHVHPALSRFTYRRQKSLITEEHRRFVEETGITPKTFSGGHWCINTDTLNIVKALGMVVDASVVPGLRVFSCNGTIIQYPQKPEKPYWVSMKNLTKQSTKKELLEMPVTLTADNGIMDTTTVPTWTILKTYKQLSEQGHPAYLHMTFHSYDILFPNGNTNFFLDKLSFLCETLHRRFHSVRFMTCYEYYLKQKGEKNENNHRTQFSGRNGRFGNSNQKHIQNC